MYMYMYVTYMYVSVRDMYFIDYMLYITSSYVKHTSYYSRASV